MTIAGQSAGGAACAALLGVPAARGLFRGAACMSGGPALMQTADGVRAVAARMAGHLGIPALDRAALEQLPAETILAAQEAVTGEPGSAGRSRDAEASPPCSAAASRCPGRRGPTARSSPRSPCAAAARRGTVKLPCWPGPPPTSSTWPGYRRTGSPRTWRPKGWPRRVSRRRWPPPTSTGPDRGRAARWGRPSPTGRSGSRPSTWPRPRRRRADRPTPTTSAGLRRTGPLAGLAFHCLDVPFFFDALGEPGVAEAAGPAPPGALAADMHGALVRFVTDGAPGWEPHGAGRRPVMVFAEPSACRKTRWRWNGWPGRSRRAVSPGTEPQWRHRAAVASPPAVRGSTVLPAWMSQPCTPRDA